ncbi:TonB-dependent receptor [Flammeovirga sp. EKP202]|uniref:SusC/RagA family TonB-linked outer membrane protein n=1 Tax=Flammeovirga sp. EKP202 TaxID=2770592 RepID=UPI00165EBE83|nr:TonB-dependent receptor [Flammeovirga sp. EKP202]MBD0404228.1 TonB-dependent receptor [Flammeovirga sp. EKP202]
MRKITSYPLSRFVGLVIFLLQTITTITFAQEQTILTGVVMNEEDNFPLPVASIKIKGTTKGTVTDLDGAYSIQVEKGQELVISYLGMETQTWTYNGASKHDFYLRADAAMLDDVVVVGYGTVQKRDLTGSISKVKEDENVVRQYNDLDQMLQGRVSGVQVIGNEGAQGGAVSVKIRGVNSLRGNNEPLYVVDGIIISSAGDTPVNVQGGNSAPSAQNGLAGINPKDIEDIEVLKDASATAIYGSRGANGVVLITTKKGTKGAAKVNFFANTSISEPSKTIDVLDGFEYAQFINDVNLSNNQVPLYQLNPETREVYQLASGNLLQQHNWQDEIYRTGVSYNAGASISGANETTDYYISMGYNNKQGVIPNSFSQSGDLRINLGQKISEKLRFEAKTTLNILDGSYAQTGERAGGSRSLINQMVGKLPLTGLNIDGEDDGDAVELTPWDFMKNNDDLTKQFRTIIGGKLEYKIVKGLKATLRTGADLRNQDRSIWFGPGTFQGNQLNGYLNTIQQKRSSYNIDGIVNFNRTFNRKHRVGATAVVTYDYINSQNTTYAVSNFIDHSFRGEAPQYGQDILSPQRTLTYEESIFSYLGRVNYTFNNKYIMTANFRADKSSKFEEGKQWGFFPSASVAWYISEEDFLKTSSSLSDLKLRAGWGRTGNQAIQPFQTLSNYTNNLYPDGNNGNQVGLIPGNLANTNLTWETTDQINVGLDFGFLKSRITGTVDLYSKHTMDLLQRLQAPTSTGFKNYYINRGEMYNRGVELNLNTVIVDNDTWGVNIGGSLTKNITEIGELGIPESTIYIDGQPQQVQGYLGNEVSSGGTLNGPANIFVKGMPVGVFYGYKTNGIYATEEAAKSGPTFNGNANQAGDVIFVDQNGDGNITSDDKTIIGDPNPDFMYSINMEFRYKIFRLSMLWNGVYGNDVLNADLVWTGYPSPVYNSWNVRPETYYNAWTPQNTNTDTPRIGYGYGNSMGSHITDRMIEDGSYLRLSNVTFTVDLPTDKWQSIGAISIYCTVRNPITITNYSGYDPEVTSFLYDGTIMGTDWGAYANLRTYLMGINVTF